MATGSTVIYNNTTLDEESSPIFTTTEGLSNTSRGSHHVSDPNTSSNNDGGEGLTMMANSMEDSHEAMEYSAATSAENFPRSHAPTATAEEYATGDNMESIEHQEQQPMDTANPSDAVMDSSPTEIVEDQGRDYELSPPRKRIYEETKESPSQYHAMDATEMGVATTTEESNLIPHDQYVGGGGVADPTTREDNSEHQASKRFKSCESDVQYLDTSANSGRGAASDVTTYHQEMQAPSPPPPSMVGQQSKKVNNEQWDAMFKKLVEYKELHGDCLVPKRYARDPRLGTWVETQRVQYKRLVRTTDEQSGIETVQPNKRLNAERLHRLESIGFAWSAKNIRKQTKHLQLQILQDPATSPRSISPVGTELTGTTTNNVAKTKNFKAAKPKGGSGGAKKGNSSAAGTNERYDVLALSSINTSLRAAARQRLNDAQWDDMYNRLKTYKEQFGDCLVPRKYESDPKLASWVETQRVLWNRDLRLATANPSLETPVASNDTLPDSTSATVMGQAAIDGAVTDAAESATPNDSANTAVLPLFGVEVLPSTAAAAEVAIQQAGDDEVVIVMGGSAPASATAGGTAATHPAAVPGAATGDQNPAAANSCVPALPAAKPSQQRVQVVKRLTPERKQKLDDIGFVWSLRSKRIEDHWDDMFRQLVEYKEKHGDCLVPSRYEDNLKLGKWVETQRYEYTKLQRAAEQRLPKKDAAKNATAPAVAAIVPDTVGGADVPAATGNIPCKPPAATPKQGRPVNPRLTEDRLRRLEAIGFEWKVKHKMKRYYDKQWDQMFERLLAFKAATGHCMVPKRYPPDMKLGTWVHTQRIQYRKLKSGTKTETAKEAAESGAELAEAVKQLKKETAAGERVEEVSYRLTDARRKRLEEVGFVWSAREGEKGSETGGRITRNSYDDQWDTMFEKLKEYKEKHGDCLVPKRYKEFPKLGTWVDTQRVQFKKLKKKLASQGQTYEGPVPPSDDSDSDGGKASDENTVPAMSPKPLVGRLTDDRIRRLQSLGFVWSLRDDWQKHYEELKAFKAKHGHCNVPARYNANRRLGIWVSAQRQQYKIMNQSQETDRPRRSAPLTQERIDYLNAIGFTWTIRSRDSLGESWNQRLQELKLFKAQYGHCLVPSRYTPNPELGVWVGTQRTQYRLHKRAKETGITVNGATAMNEERIRELEELGFVWALRGGEGKLIDENPVAANASVGAVSNPSGASMHYDPLAASGQSIAVAAVNPVGPIRFDGDVVMKEASNLEMSTAEI